jgi:hypothetical protein
MPMEIERIEMVDDEMALHLRALSGGERLRIASGMFAAARWTADISTPGLAGWGWKRPGKAWPTWLTD